MHAHTHISLSERIFRARIIANQERDVIFKWFSPPYYFLITYFIISALSPFSHPWCIFLLVCDDPLVAYSHIALSFRLLLFWFFCCFLCICVTCVSFYGLSFFFCNGFVKDGVVIFIPLLHFQGRRTIQVCSSECPSSPIVSFIVFLREWRSQEAELTDPNISAVCVCF